MSTGKFVSLLVLPWSVAFAVVFLNHMGRSAATSDGRDDRLVYAAMLDSLSHGNRIVVLVDSSEELKPSAPTRVLRTVQTHRPLYLVPRSVVASRPTKDGFDRDYWNRFEAAYPDAFGWYEVSAITYRGRDEAVLTYGHHCGWLCGSGGTVELLRSEEGWKVMKVSIHWVS